MNDCIQRYLSFTRKTGFLARNLVRFFFSRTAGIHKIAFLLILLYNMLDYVDNDDIFSSTTIVVDVEKTRPSSTST